MAITREIGKYSIGIGDRFGKQGKAQLTALLKAQEQGIEITPVWNKSFREHRLIGTQPQNVREEAEAAVQSCGWSGSYFVDADHVGMKNVDIFIDASDFFTLDVADFIGRRAGDDEIRMFVTRNVHYAGDLHIPGLDSPMRITRQMIESVAEQYLYAVMEAGRVYRTIAGRKPSGSFVVEVSMDETQEPQKPAELFFILAAIAGEGIPLQTIAPKFTGRFNKGVDYSGDVQFFKDEFVKDLAVVKYAIIEFSLPRSCKLSVHSGSDKFALYGPIHEALKAWNTGLHLKTAGTTWLEEVIGLAEAGGEGLEIAKLIWSNAYNRMDELCQPYATVIDIRRELLPSPQNVDAWDSHAFVSALRHDSTNPDYNPHFRQLLHVSFKIAAEMGSKYLDAIEKYATVISRNVTDNLYERHIKRLFL
jgi:tagaturonate epimerase